MSQAGTSAAPLSTPETQYASGNIARLAIGQAPAGANSTVVYATGAIVGNTLAPDKALATLPISIFVVGMAACTLPAGAIARRHGRRAAFLAGTGCGVLVGLLAALAVVLGSFWLFCFATFFGGAYAAVALSFRFAAADGERLHPRTLLRLMAFEDQRRGADEAEVPAQPEENEAPPEMRDILPEEPGDGGGAGQRQAGGDHARRAEAGDEAAGEEARRVHRDHVPLQPEIGRLLRKPAQSHRQRRSRHQEIHKQVGNDAADHRDDEAGLARHHGERAPAGHLGRGRHRQADAQQDQPAEKRHARLRQEGRREEVLAPQVHGVRDELRADDAGEDSPGHDERQRPRTPPWRRADFIVFGTMALGSLASGGLLTAYGWDTVLWVSFGPLALAVVALLAGAVTPRSAAVSEACGETSRLRQACPPPLQGRPRGSGGHTFEEAQMITEIITFSLPGAMTREEVVVNYLR